MSQRIYVSQDASALSLGAEQTAAALLREAQARGLDIELVRTGSRGMFWLEPLVEVQTPQGRVGYGPVKAADVAGLLDDGLLGATASRLRLGLTEDIPYFARQDRRNFRRVGIVDPRSLADYVAHGGYAGLRRALQLGQAATLQAVADSGLRGRGGAGFPTGIKWRTVAAAPGPQKYVVCNADEGDSGTFSDRMLMEGDPFCLIEGMTISAWAVGATQGYIYVRSEYPHAERALQAAIDAAVAQGYLGRNILGSDLNFRLEVRRGAGAYVCGEETSLLESLEGRRGLVRFRPPLPAISGLFGKPTVINNVMSFGSVPVILDEGAQAYADAGVGRSRGTLPFQLAGNIRYGGLVEVPFGLPLRTLLEDFGGGTLSGRPISAVQMGGPLGAYLPPSTFDTPLDYEAFAAIGGMIGHGGIVVFDDTADFGALARHAMAFCAFESCGKCTPCRIGSTRGTELIEEMIAARDSDASDGNAGRAALLKDLCEVMTAGSLCALGGMTPAPVLSILQHFPAALGAESQPQRSLS